MVELTFQTPACRMALTADASDEVGALGGCVVSHLWVPRSRDMNEGSAVQDEGCFRRVACNPAPRRSSVQFFSKVTFAAAPEVLSFVPGSRLVAGPPLAPCRATHLLQGILRSSTLVAPASTLPSNGGAWPSNSLSQPVHPVGSAASVQWPTEAICQDGPDVSLASTPAFSWAQVQSEPSSLSQPVCPVGSTALASRPVTGPFSHTAQDWVLDCAPVPLDTGRCQHHTSTRPVHPVGRTASAAPLAPIVLPGGMAPRTKATPLISDLQAMLASHVPLRPEWVSGPLLHMSPFEARWLAAFLPVEHDRRRFTVFDCRLDLMSRASDPEWSLLDYVTAAVRSVPYRVRLIWYIVRPIPDLPTPQFSVTAQDAPGGTRAIPVDLRGLGGMLHTIEVGPGPLRPLWAELRAKGVDPGSRLEQAWLDDLCEFRDEQGRRVDTITADGTSPEWLVLSLTDPLAPVHIEVDYVGGAGPVLRVPPPVPPPRGPCSTPASTTCTTTAVAVQPVTHHCQAVCLDEIAVLPEDLASPAERLLSMGAVPGLRYLLRERVPLQRHYTLFERAGNLHIRPLRPEWSLLDLVQDVMLVVPMLRSIQVLHSPLDRLPVLQVAATELGWPADSLAIPFDLRGAGLQICTLVVGPGLTQRILHEAVWTECAAGRSGVPDTVPFADSLGRTGDTRRPLVDVQFFVPVYPAVWANDPAVTGLAADDTHSPTSPLSATSAPSCLGSTTTTTGAMQWAGVRISRQGVDQTAQYMLADHCQLAVFTAHSVEYGPLSPMGSPLAETLAPLLARILGRGHGPRMGFLQSSRVLPMNDNRVWLVPIIWAERTGTHVHVIFDARCAHGELQM